MHEYIPFLDIITLSHGIQLMHCVRHTKKPSSLGLDDSFIIAMCTVPGGAGELLINVP